MSAKPVKTRKDFDAELAAGKAVTALFYSAWCPFCTSFLPSFERQARGGGGFIKVCTDDIPDLEDMFSVDVVPTVLHFEGGRLSRRLDGRLGLGLTEDGLASFLKDCRGSAGK